MLQITDGSHIDNLDPCTRADFQDFASDSRESLKQAQNLSSVFYVVLMVDWGPRSNFHSFLSTLTALSSPGPTSKYAKAMEPSGGHLGIPGPVIS